MPNFRRDLERGQTYELKALELLEYDSYERPEGKFSDYDIKTCKDGKYTKYEVKADFSAKRTGNLGIEFYCNGKPSGVSTTKADFWLHFDVDEPNYSCYIMPVKELKKHIVDNPDYKRCRGGDFNRSQLVCIPKKNLNKYLLSKNKSVLTYTYDLPPKTKMAETKMTYTDKLIKKFEDEKQTSYEVDEIVKLIKNFQLEQTKLRKQKTDEVPVGKYKFKKVKDVANFDKQYLVWILKQDWVTKYPEFVTECKKYI